MRTAFSAALDAEPAVVRDRVAVRAGSAGRLAAVTGGERYDAVLLLGVLMYLRASGPVIAERATHVTPGGELAALLDVEERLGATDPYRQLGQLAHLILRRMPAQP
jgi:hypothetical protein